MKNARSLALIVPALVSLAPLSAMVTDTDAAQERVSTPLFAPDSNDVAVPTAFLKSLGGSSGRATFQEVILNGQRLGVSVSVWGGEFVQIEDRLMDLATLTFSKKHSPFSPSMAEYQADTRTWEAQKTFKFKALAWDGRTGSLGESEGWTEILVNYSIRVLDYGDAKA